MKLFRIGICVFLAFAVLAFGAVEEWAQAVLEVGASFLLLLCALQLYLRKEEQLSISAQFLPLGMFALVILAQLAFQTTASSYHTRVDLQLLITYLIVLFLMPQAYRRANHYRGLLWFLMGLSFFVSIFAILQHLTFNGKLYWFRELHYGGYPFGPYANRNHFAGFAELLIPMALVPLVLGKVRRERLVVVSLFALVPMVALLLSASRGGIASFVVEMIILFLLLLVRRVRRRHVLVGGVVVLGAVMGVAWIGVHDVLRRFSMNHPLEVSEGKRISMMQDTWHIFLDHPILGTGLGTLQMVFPPYETLYDGKVVNHTHNDYLEALGETGLLGGLCCGWFLSVLLLESLRGLRELGSSFRAALNLSGLVGCSGILVHSLVDFNLHIPANGVLFFVAAHLATTRLENSSPDLSEGSSLRSKKRKH